MEKQKPKLGAPACWKKLQYEKTQGRYEKLHDASEQVILDIKKKIASEIRDHVIKKRINQTDIARETGLPQADVNRIINGRVEVRSLKFVIALAAYLGVDTGFNMKTS
ncbi:helix-turn-helix domain-containing protein [Roseovarius mucosus]|uniref:helix-turn-helix domain-containing protein n=1 Tax=Roseovarius mucosus TaxID=215743 RepID=UPI0009D9B9A5|nr:helix-turn-helix transcriptional regulator [Roseovarius mucosus]